MDAWIETHILTVIDKTHCKSHCTKGKLFMTKLMKELEKAIDEYRVLHPEAEITDNLDELIWYYR